LRIFIAGCVATIAAVIGLSAWQRMSTQQQLDEQAATIEASMTARVAAYESLLRGAIGLFANEPWINRGMFDAFIRQLDLDQNYPGVLGIGLSLRLPPERIAAAEKRMREDGVTGFRVWPTMPREEIHTILHIAPDNDRNRMALGYDMHTEPVRRAAMDLARDTGRLVVSGKVTLVQEIDLRQQAGFLMYAPFYVGGERPATPEARRQRLAGYAYAAFRAGDWLAAFIEPMALHGIHLSVYDGPTADVLSALMYTTRTPAEPRPRNVVRRVHTVQMVQRSWTLVFEAAPRSSGAPLIAGLAGLLASACAGLLLLRFERTRAQAEESEAAKREREVELALLVDAVPALVIYVDQDGRVRSANRRFVDWFGVDPAKIAGRLLADVAGPKIFPEIEAHVAKALSGRGVSFERWHQIPGAGARFLHTIYVPHRAENGAISGFYALTSDLTAHKRAEEAARFVADCGKLLIAAMEFESTTRGIVHLAVPRVADVAVLFRVNEGHLDAVAVAHVDDVVEQHLGQFLSRVRLSMSADHNIAIAARTGLPVVSTQLNREELMRVAADEGQRQMLEVLQLRSALHVPVVVRGQIWAVFSFGTSMHSGRQFTDDDRQLAEEISTRVRLAVENALLYREAQQEIEDRRRAERVARETEERFRLLVEGVHEYAIVALNREGRIESWNEGAERILGWSAEEAIGMTADSLYREEDRAADIPRRQLKFARERGASSDEHWFVRKDGTQLWASSHTAVLRDADHVRGYAWILRDLTDRKRVEEELERRVQLRTTELNDAVHELEAFSYSVSHDLRSPLRTIRGFTELALEEAKDRLKPEEANYLDRVRRASLRLERLISDLLTYTRISKTKVELTPVDLHGLVADIQREHPEFQQPRADVQIEGQLLPVLGNEAYLTQCLTNLLGNAVKFVAGGQLPVVRIRTEKRDRVVRLFVSDNGIGIPAAHLAKAFEMFERLHPGGNYEGTGVGLAIVRRAVQRMGGKVSVESAVGRGTTFCIELPAAS
jgi:PAS domain S-box-containing protein